MFLLVMRTTCERRATTCEESTLSTMPSTRTTRTWRNWAGNQTARPTSWYEPRDASEARQVVYDAANEGRRVKVVGSGHSFTAAAVADDVLIDVARLCEVGTVDPATGEGVGDHGCRNSPDRWRGECAPKDN